MCDRNKVQQILRYVWLPTSISLNEDLSCIADLICEKLDGYGDLNDLNELLEKISIKKFDGNIASEKNLETAKLIVGWYGAPLLRTDYAVMRFTFGRGYTLLSYKNNEKELKLTFDMTLNNEVIVNPDEIILEEEEKKQLLKIIQETYKGRLILDN